MNDTIGSKESLKQLRDEALKVIKVPHSLDSKPHKMGPKEEISRVFVTR